MGTALIITCASERSPDADTASTASTHATSTAYDIVIAADGGFDRAVTVGLQVDLVVGDLDSVDLDALLVAEAGGTVVERHPTAKDATDLELAIEAALTRHATSITVLGGIGDRFDHLVGELGLLASPSWRHVTIEGRYGPARVRVLHGPDTTDITGAPGSLVSLIPMHGSAIGVTTRGLRHPLSDEDLPAGTTRGVSNVVIQTEAAVTVRAGCLLIVQPHRFEALP